MGYYNRSGRKLEIREENLVYLGSGYQAKVFRDGTRAVKKYHKNTDSGRISLSVFDYLKNIHNPHMMRLEDVFCEVDSSHLPVFLKGDYSFHLDGYLAKYYEDASTNVLLTPTDYLLDNFRELDQLMERFANDGMRVMDLSRDNAILGSENIVLIDPDEFCEGEDPIAISFDNKRRLVGLLKGICRSGVEPQFGIPLLSVSTGMNIEVHYNTDIAYELSKKIGSYPRPIDYFMRK